MSKTFTVGALNTFFEVTEEGYLKEIEDFKVVVESDQVDEPIKYQCTGITIDKTTKEMKIRY